MLDNAGFAVYRTITPSVPKLPNLDCGRQKSGLAFLVQLDHSGLPTTRTSALTPLRQLRSDVTCWSTAATRAIRIRRA